MKIYSPEIIDFVLIRRETVNNRRPVIAILDSGLGSCLVVEYIEIPIYHEIVGYALTLVAFYRYVQLVV